MALFLRDGSVFLFGSFIFLLALLPFFHLFFGSLIFLAFFILLFCLFFILISFYLFFASFILSSFIYSSFDHPFNTYDSSFILLSQHPSALLVLYLPLVTESVSECHYRQYCDVRAVLHSCDV